MIGVTHDNPRPRQPARRPGPGAQRSAPRKRVVIADDDALIRVDLSELLIAEGFDVVGQAADGAQAVLMTADLTPDVVVLDVMMPVQDGIDAAAEIVSRHCSPVVLLSAFHDRELRRRAVDAGVLAYVSKPSVGSSLLPALELAIARHAERSALRNQAAGAIGRLRDRRVIEQAKILLMKHHRISEDEAFRRLHRTAMDQRTSMVLASIAVMAELSHLRN